MQAQSQSTISVCQRGQQVPCRWPKELDDRVPLCLLALHCLSTAVVLLHSSLLCVFPDQLIPRIIWLPQHPFSVTSFLSRIHGTRERKRHLTSMLRLCTGNFLDVNLQRCRPQSHGGSHASSETGELAQLSKQLRTLKSNRCIVKVANEFFCKPQC